MSRKSWDGPSRFSPPICVRSTINRCAYYSSLSEKCPPAKHCSNMAHSHPPSSTPSNQSSPEGGVGEASDRHSYQGLAGKPARPTPSLSRCSLPSRPFVLASSGRSVLTSAATPAIGALSDPEEGTGDGRSTTKHPLWTLIAPRQRTLECLPAQEPSNHTASWHPSTFGLVVLMNHLCARRCCKLPFRTTPGANNFHDVEVSQSLKVSLQRSPRHPGQHFQLRYCGRTRLKCH